MDADAAGSDAWAGRFEQQALACEALGSPLWGRLLHLIARDTAAEGPSWSVVRERAALRFGQAGPLRLAGAAHRLALTGAAPGFASMLPSCGGVAPAADAHGDAELSESWYALLDAHGGALVAGLDREVQTNEVARAAALLHAHAVAFDGPDRGGSDGGGPDRVGPDRVGPDRVGPDDGGSVEGPDGVRLVELGCSGGLNLRMDRFRVDLGAAPGGGPVLGDPDSAVRLAPEVRAPIGATGSPLPIRERIGIDPHPIDPCTDDGRTTLLSFVWPDQVERFDRLAAAVDLARRVPADLRATGGRGTAEVLAELLAEPVGGAVGGASGQRTATVVQHSVVWQYVPVDQRPAITSVMESAGASATRDRPLVWIRYEPDEWNRSRAAVWVRRWPHGGDRLVAHVDFHGRWLAPVASS